ncbi:MAG: RNA-binding protein [bacterium]
MGTKLYVGNLADNVTEGVLQDLFSQCGAVTDVHIILDKFSGRSRGFAFVTMGTDQEAQQAIATLHDKEVEGRKIIVNEARPREEHGGFGGGSGGSGSSSGGGFGGGRRPFNKGRQGGGKPPFRRGHP